MTNAVAYEVDQGVVELIENCFVELCLAALGMQDNIFLQLCAKITNKTLEAREGPADWQHADSQDLVS